MIVIQKSPEEQEINQYIEEQKRLSKQLEDMQNKDVKPKKTIIVIGRMGHGKSSFIKMLVSQEDKARIKSAPSRKSVTDQCSLFEICPEIKRKLQIPEEQNIYLMDTPGLNSNAKNYLLMDQIRKKLILQKCQVISILYIKNSTQFRQEQENDSIAMYYALPIPKKIKDEITSFVLTNYDRQVLYQKQFETFMSSFRQSYQKNNLDFLLSTTIKWMSYTQQKQDNQSFEEILQIPKFKKAFQKQWQDLKQILKIKSENKFTYNQLIQVSGNFNLLWKQKFQKILKQQKQSIKDQIYFYFSTVDQQLSFIQKVKQQFQDWGHLAIIFPIVFVGFFPQILSHGDKRRRANKMIDQFSKIKDKNQIEKMKQQLSLEDLSTQYVNNYCLKNLNFQNGFHGQIQFQFSDLIQQITIKSKKINPNQFTITNAMKWIYRNIVDDSQNGFLQEKYIKRTEGEDVLLQTMKQLYNKFIGHKQKGYGQVKQNGTKRVFGIFTLKKNHNYKFIIKIKRPTQKVIVDLIKQTTFEIYGK